MFTTETQLIESSWPEAATDNVCNIRQDDDIMFEIPTNIGIITNLTLYYENYSQQEPYSTIELYGDSLELVSISRMLRQIIQLQLPYSFFCQANQANQTDIQIIEPLILLGGCWDLLQDIYINCIAETVNFLSKVCNNCQNVRLIFRDTRMINAKLYLTTVI